MGKTENRPVRMGWLSLLVTVVLLCLATLAVLAFTTARSDLALARRQAQMTQALYAREQTGQELLAQVDALGKSGDTPTQIAKALGGEVSPTTTLLFTIRDEEGGVLDIELAPDWNGGYEILAWRHSVEWQPSSVDAGLWGVNRA